MAQNKKTSVALYTWCNDIGPSNYGQTLQCYATQFFLEKMGAEVRIVRYRKIKASDNPPDIEENRLEYERKYRIQVVEKDDNQRITKFFNFVDEKLNCLPFCYDERELKDKVKDFDVLLLGSDQLWAPQWFDQMTLFKYAEDKQRKVTYATSGLNDSTVVGKRVCDEIGRELENFYRVSVRERYAKDILEQYCKTKNIVEVIDPVFLVDRNQWTDISQGEYEEDYLLCFFLGKFTDKKIVIKELMKRHSVNNVIYIKSNYYDEGIVSEDIFFEAKDVGPKEFLSLIRNAKAVFTDSFHGSAFSIIFKKQFYVAKYNNPVRIHDLCQKMEIGNRNAYSLRHLNLIDEIDYEKVEEKMDYWIEQSIVYISEAVFGE